jgi:ribosomal-protein-alanine N-acetyltransferase
MAWVIRQFEREDLDVVMEINRTSLPENYPDTFFLGLYYHAPKAFLVAVDDSRVVGYIMCRIERGVSSYGRLPVKKGHIVSVAVIPEYRRQGLGSDLVKAAMKSMEAYGSSECFLEVRKSNEAAVSIYEILAFDMKRVLKGYYRDGEDAYLMTRKLEPQSGGETDAEE